jgi:anaerobic magnesium-protoporphyrin IX monomethyl ester cyclase
MKVLLIYPTQPAVATQPPLGLMYIASYLRAAGHQPKIIEGNAETIKKMQYYHPFARWDVDFIGITCMTSMYQEILKIRDHFHQYQPDIPLIFGGVHATILPESLLSEDGDFTDYVVQGEGERAMLSIVNGQISGSAILQGNRVENLDELPFPARDLVNKRYLKHSVSMLAARGCPFNCSFCQPTLRKLFGSRIRRRSAPNVIAEMMDSNQRFNVRNFEFFDDTFTADKNWVYDFCEELAVAQKAAEDSFWGIPYIWKCLSRVDVLDYDLLKTMKSVGLTKLSLGIESGSQEILDSYQKGITIEQAHEVLKWCEQLKIKVHGFFMIGALDETDNTIMETRRFIRSHKFDTIFVTVTTPTPCTQLYDRAEKEGALRVPWEQFDLLGSLTTTVKPRSPEEAVPMIGYYLEPRQILKARYEILREFYMKKLRNPLYLWQFIRANSLEYGWEAAKNVFH